MKKKERKKEGNISYEMYTVIKIREAFFVFVLSRFYVN